jgi:hypothetical protein
MSSAVTVDSLWCIDPIEEPHANLEAVESTVAAYLLPGARDWVHDAVVQMKELLLLNEDWDGMGAKPLHPVVVDTARGLLEGIVEVSPNLLRPFISPTVHGGIALEWHSGPAEVEIVLNPEGAWTYAADGEQTWEGSLEEPPPEAVDLLLTAFVVR